jgi:hypothetical protein
MSLHINRFIDNLKAHESRNAKDFIMPMRDAKDLHADITKLLLAVTELQNKLIENQQVIEVELTGKQF